MIHLSGVLAAAGELQRFCRGQGWRFCFIGGIALQRWGEPRFTQDVDLTLLTGFGNEETFVDAALGAFPFEERSVQRASEWAWAAGQSLVTCSAEDLVVHKAFAGRDLDWSDVERVLTRQHGKLNVAQVRAELAPLLELKGTPESLDKLSRLFDTVERRLRTRP